MTDVTAPKITIYAENFAVAHTWVRIERPGYTAIEIGLSVIEGL